MNHLTASLGSQRLIQRWWGLRETEERGRVLLRIRNARESIARESFNHEIKTSRINIYRKAALTSIIEIPSKHMPQTQLYHLLQFGDNLVEIKHLNIIEQQYIVIFAHDIWRGEGWWPAPRSRELGRIGWSRLEDSTRPEITCRYTSQQISGCHDGVSVKVVGRCLDTDGPEGANVARVERHYVE